MTVYRFTIPGKPYAKKRHKAGYNPKLGRAVSYNAPGNEQAEATVAYYAGQVIPAPIEGPVRVTITAIFEIPKSWSLRRRAEAFGQYHTQKPDRDNVEKWILDGLNRVAFADDGQVADGRTIKLWGKRAETIIEIAPATRAFGNWEPNDATDLRNRLLGDGAA